MTTPGDYTRTTPVSIAPAARPAAHRAGLMVVVGLVFAAILVPLDGPVAHFARRLQAGGDLAIKGDLARTLQFLQQFGDLASSVVIASAVLLLDPAARRRIWDWLAAALATSLVVWLLKMLIARPRPALDQPLTFLGPFRAFSPTPNSPSSDAALKHSWEFWRHVSDLWSMPSSHTSAAVALSVVLVRLYPRLTPLCVPFVAVVALTRVAFGSHYPSDVVLGAVVGYAIASTAWRGAWGQRLTSPFRGRRAHAHPRASP